MNDQQDILNRIKATVKQVEPEATVILYGSRARGDHREDSDYDLLILIDGDGDKLSYTDKAYISSPLNEIAVDTTTSIFAKVYTRKGWANHRVTPFYENVNREGVEI